MMSSRSVVRVLSSGVAAALIVQLALWGSAPAAASPLPDEPAAVDPAAAPAAVAPAAAIVAGSVSGPTVLSGYKLTSDETWGPEGSPYLLSGQTTVPAGVSLTLLPGTVVKFDGQTSKLLVWGQLLSLGLPDHRVVITSVKDDAVGGDSNGDGDASSPGRGDWGNLDFRLQNSSSPQLGSVIDYTDVRYGDYGSAIACQTGMVSVTGAVPITISNSNLTDARISPLILGSTSDTAPVGIYNNTFARANCGLTSFYGRADILGNTFEDSLGRATYISYPKRVRFWFNTLRSQPVVNGGTVTRADADVRYNSLLAGIYHWYPGSQDLQDWSGNWFGIDTTAPLPDCVVKADADAWIPAIYYSTSSSCPSGQVHPTGYRGDATGSMTAAPLPIPASVLDAQSPRVGPVDTRTGALSYSVSDLAVQDAGKELSATRSYRSDRASSSPGHGWTGSYGEAVSSDASGTATLNLADGSTLPFHTDSQAGYVPAQGVGADFSTGSSGTTITTSDRTTYQFSASGELDSVLMQDPDHKVTVHHANGEVSDIEGVSGRKIWFDHDAGRLSVVRDSTGRRAEFSYDGDRLVAAKGVDGEAETYSYDNDGHLTEVKAPSGQVTLAAGYDAQGRVSWLEQQGSGRLEFSYDTNARRTTTHYVDGHTLVQQYDDLGRLVAETVGSASHHLVYDAEGRQVADVRGVPTTALTGYSALSTATSYNRQGNQVWQSDPTGVWTQTTFSSDRQPLVTTYSDGGTVTRTYNDDNRLASITDQLGGEYHYTYGRFGEVKTQTDPLDRTRSLTYAENGDLATSTDEYGATTSYATNDRGKITQVTDAEGGVHTTSFTNFDAVSQTTNPGGGGNTISYDTDRRVTQVTTAVSATETATTTYEYNTQGQLSAVVDPAGGRSTTEYNQLGLPVKSTDAAGAITLQAYTDEGWLASSTDPLGGVTTYEQDPGGRDYRVTDPLGQVPQTLWDRAGRPAAVWTPAGGKTVIGYDRVGRQATVVTPLGKTWTTTYDLAGSPTKWKDPLGNTTTATYDLLGRRLTSTNELGEVVETSYDEDNHRTTISDALGIRERTTLNALGLVAAYRDANGGVTHYDYNADGLPTTEDGPAGTTHTSYDLAGRTTSSTDAAGRTTSYHLDELGRVTFSEIGGATTRYEYDQAGRVTKQTDAEGRIARYHYDAAGNLTRSIDGLDHTTNYDYDALSRLVKTTDPTGVTTNQAYDPLGRVAVTWDQLGASWVTTYDLDGNAVKSTDPSGIVHSYTYDGAGRMLTDRNDNGVTFTYTWDKAGRMLTASDPYKTTYTYDVRDRVTSTTNGVSKKTTTDYATTDDGQSVTRTTPSGNATTIEIDHAGRITTATDPTGATVALDWTPDSKLDKVTLPLGGTYQYRYDDQGNLASETNPLGDKTRYSYDKTGLVTTTDYPSGRTVDASYDDAAQLVESIATRPGHQADTRSFSYDDAGRVTQAATTGPSGDATASWRYNTRGLLARTTTSQGDISYSYDLAQRPQSVVGATGQTLTFGYDTSNKVSTVRGAINLNLAHNKAGQLTTRTPVSPTTGMIESRAYDNAGQPTSISGGTSHTLTYTDDGLVSTDKTAAGTTNYSYDAAGRLTREKVTSGTSVTADTSYTWDADGNRSSKTSGTDDPVTYTYNAADQLIADSLDTSYATNADGLVTEQGELSLDYNAFGELTATTGPEQSTAYTRDALGRIAAQTTDGDTTTLAYHGQSGTLAGYNTASGSQIDIQTAPDATLLGYTPATGTSQLVHTNSHGDVEKVLTGKTTTSQSTYDAFGNTTASSGTPLVPLGFQSALTDPASGLLAMGARSYDPTLGRFTQADTITGTAAIPASFNRYLYAFGSPTNMVDPTGHWPSWLTGIVNTATSLFKDAVSTVGKAISSAGKALAKAGSAVRAAVQTATKQVTKAVSSAAKWAYDNREELGAIAVSVVADVVVTGACEAVTAGVGSIGCVVAGGFAGGAVYGALKCPHDNNQGQCILENGATGAAFSFAGGIAGEAITKVAGRVAETKAAQTLIKGTDDTPAGTTLRRILGLTDEGSSAGATAETRAVRGGTEAADDVGAVVAGKTGTSATNTGGKTLFHYTDEVGQRGILENGKLNPSLKSVSPKDARHGDGQYLSDIAPGSRTCAQLSACFLGIPYQGRKFTHYVEIDISGLNIVKGRDGVFVNPSATPLDITQRLVSAGVN